MMNPIDEDIVIVLVYFSDCIPLGIRIQMLFDVLNNLLVGFEKDPLIGIDDLIEVDCGGLGRGHWSSLLGSGEVADYGGGSCKG